MCRVSASIIVTRVYHRDMTTNEPRYTAAYNQANLDLTIIRGIPTVLSGPCVETVAASLNDADHTLWLEGFARTSDWGPADSNGTQWCDLARIEG